MKNNLYFGKEILFCLDTVGNGTLKEKRNNHKVRKSNYNSRLILLYKYIIPNIYKLNK